MYALRTHFYYYIEGVSIRNVLNAKCFNLISVRFTDKQWNPTAKTAANLQRKLQNLKQSGNLSEDEYKRLRVPDSNPASLYGLPKVHKVYLRLHGDHYAVPAEVDRITLRPINSCIGASTYQASKYLAKVLRTLQKGSQYTVCNSAEFVEFVLNQRISDYEELVSLDVVNLVFKNLEQSD